MGIHDSSKGFISIIKSTKEFTELVQAKSQIEKNSSLKNKFLDFNKRLEDIYASSKSSNVVESKVSDLNRQFSSLFKEPEVDKFLRASKDFNEMMSKVYKSISDSLDIDLRIK